VIHSTLSTCFSFDSSLSLSLAVGAVCNCSGGVIGLGDSFYSLDLLLFRILSFSLWLLVLCVTAVAVLLDYVTHSLLLLLSRLASLSALATVFLYYSQIVRSSAHTGRSDLRDLSKLILYTGVIVESGSYISVKDEVLG